VQQQLSKRSSEAGIAWLQRCIERGRKEGRKEGRKVRKKNREREGDRETEIAIAIANGRKLNQGLPKSLLHDITSDCNVCQI
jgi:hypothetical protein